MNLGYSTIRSGNGSQWSFDTTLQWIGQQRMPGSMSNPTEFQWKEKPNDYFLLSAQIAKSFNRNLRVYIGGDNLLSYTQDDAIVDAQHPFSNYFDGGMLYAPVMPAISISELISIFNINNFKSKPFH